MTPAGTGIRNQPSSQEIMRNGEIAEAFEELASLYELDGAVVYRVNAYRNAAKAIREAGVSVDELAREGRVEELARMLSGRGSGTARAHAEELLRSSRAEAVQDEAVRPAKAARPARGGRARAPRVGRSSAAAQDRS